MLRRSWRPSVVSISKLGLTASGPLLKSSATLQFRFQADGQPQQQQQQQQPPTATETEAGRRKGGGTVSEDPESGTRTTEAGFDADTGVRVKRGKRSKFIKEEDAEEATAWLNLQMTVNEWYLWMKSETERGLDSPLMLFIYLTALCLACYRLFQMLIVPQLDAITPYGRTHPAPLADEHNEFFNLEKSKENQPNPMSIIWDESLSERPALVASTASDVHNVHKDDSGLRRKAGPGELHTEIAVMQQQDYDPISREDYFYRSMSTITTKQPESEDGKETSGFDRKFDSSNIFHKWKRAPLGGGGDIRLQGTVRCNALTPSDNCVPDILNVESEVYRKLLLALVPMYVARNPMEDFVEIRINFDAKTQFYNCLYLGMGTGFIPSYLNRTLPIFNIDVVEQDSAVVKMARRYFGFREQTGQTETRIFLEDPSEYVRKYVAERKILGPKLGAREFLPLTPPTIMDKEKYSMIFLDCMTDPTGRVPLKYTRLDFLNNIRQCLNPNGILIANVPNDNDRIFRTTVENIRMAFEGKTVLLINCATSPNTIVMTYNDMPTNFQDQFHAWDSVDDFKLVMNNMIKAKWGIHRHDPASEVGEHNFTQLMPGVKYKYERGVRTVAEYEQKIRDEYKKLQKEDTGTQGLAKLMSGETPDDGGHDYYKTFRERYPTWGSWYTGPLQGPNSPNTLDAHLRNTPKEFEQIQQKHTGYQITPDQEEEGQAGASTWSRLPSPNWSYKHKNHRPSGN